MATPSSKSNSSVASLVEFWESVGGNNSSQSQTSAQSRRAAEDVDALIQGLTPEQIEVLAQKVYDLLLDELRLEAERYGRRSF